LIGYYEADLLTSSSSTNRAIYKEHNLSLKACGTCNIFNTKAYNIWSKYMNIDTIYVNSGDLDGTNLPSNEKINRQSNKNYGLNFKISTACDLTNFLVTNKSLLLPTLQIRYSIDLLRYVDMNPLRKNTVTDSVKNEAFTAINGVVSENNYVKVRGLIHEYKDYLDGLNFDTSVLDPVCLANVRKGITWNKSKADLY
jgi:hypothetical protein